MLIGPRSPWTVQQLPIQIQLESDPYVSLTHKTILKLENYIKDSGTSANKPLGQQPKSTTVASLSVSHGPTSFQFWLARFFLQNNQYINFTFPTEAMYSTMCTSFDRYNVLWDSSLCVLIPQKPFRVTWDPYVVIV